MCDRRSSYINIAKYSMTIRLIQDWWNSSSQFLISNPFTPKPRNYIFSQPFKEKCISEAVRIGTIIIFKSE